MASTSASGWSSIEAQEYAAAESMLQHSRSARSSSQGLPFRYQSCGTNDQTLSLENFSHMTAGMSGLKLMGEILRMIIEILLAEGPSGKFVFPLRLVSKQLNALATPLLYRDILLNKRTVMLLVSSSASLAPHEVRIVRDIREYTRDVTLTADRVRGYAPNGADPKAESRTLWASMTERARSVKGERWVLRQLVELATTFAEEVVNPTHASPPCTLLKATEPRKRLQSLPDTSRQGFNLSHSAFTATPAGTVHPRSPPDSRSEMQDFSQRVTLQLQHVQNQYHGKGVDVVLRLRRTRAFQP
ncbi:hypothetical protein JMJ35_000367 [Cladonia borealis]|uniref:Uncharacterized protein n=1 Tax=Cladonia borealis TaxID=184061 RepID=A0AA39V5R2_9LECA|nr:hypothetical protein JMJ35_000367 [Cladonia borealis]